MERITNKHVQGTFDRLMRCAERNGMTTDGWTVTSGSKVNGISWKLVHVGPQGGQRGIFAVSGYLGMTAREAYTALQHYCQVFDAINYGRVK